jgi:hypothetical protein
MREIEVEFFISINYVDKSFPSEQHTIEKCFGVIWNPPYNATQLLFGLCQVLNISEPKESSLSR